jgi:hypothetical protein
MPNLLNLTHTTRGIASKDVRTGASLPLQTPERLGSALKGSGAGHVRIS